MAIVGEVKVITLRDVHHVGLNGGPQTVREVLGGLSMSEDVTVRINGELVRDHGRSVSDGDTITAFSSQTLATAGVKGNRKSA